MLRAEWFTVAVPLLLPKFEFAADQGATVINTRAGEETLFGV